MNTALVLRVYFLALLYQHVSDQDQGKGLSFSRIDWTQTFQQANGSGHTPNTTNTHLALETVVVVVLTASTPFGAGPATLAAFCRGGIRRS